MQNLKDFEKEQAEECQQVKSSVLSDDSDNNDDEQTADTSVAVVSPVQNTKSIASTKKIKVKKLMVNAATGAGAYPVLKRMTEEVKGWQMTLSKDADVMWISHVPTDEEMYGWLLKKKNMIINRYPGVKPVSRKDTF